MTTEQQLRQELSVLRAKIARTVQCDKCSGLNAIMRERVKRVSTDSTLPDEIRKAAGEWLSEVK